MASRSHSVPSRGKASDEPAAEKVSDRLHGAARVVGRDSACRPGLLVVETRGVGLAGTGSHSGQIDGSAVFRRRKSECEPGTADPPSRASPTAAGSEAARTRYQESGSQASAGAGQGSGREIGS